MFGSTAGQHYPGNEYTLMSEPGRATWEGGPWGPRVMATTKSGIAVLGCMGI